MKKNTFGFVLLMLLAITSCSSDHAKIDYQIIPIPNHISINANEEFTLTSQTVISFTGGNKKMKKNAEFLAQYLDNMTGEEFTISEIALESGRISLELELESDNPEEYELIVDDRGVTIIGASEAAVFYGIQTLRKSIPIVKSANIMLPYVFIEDYPRFSYRGMMLDVSRHMISVDQVKIFIDILAMHNINRFHWHLTEDQGWRIEIKKYPLLTEIGSKRKETVIGKNTTEFDGKPYGGFYTQEQIKDIVQYAADQHIVIVPEIDLPGHMLAALAAYPKLGCTGGPYEVWTKWGISPDVLCAGNAQTLLFLKDVLSEVIDLFPSEYIHIGGDECPKSSWENCPKCQSKIRSLRLRDDENHTAEEKLQSSIITEIEKFLNSKGRKLIGWDEILEGGVSPSATVMSWRGMKGGIAAAKMGNQVIMTPNNFVYFDYYQSLDRDKEPLAIGGHLPLNMVYSFEPVPAELLDDEKSNIIGAQANLWTEYIPNFDHLLYMLLPRMAALSEVQWSQPEQKNYDDFLARFPALSTKYDMYQYNYAKHVFNVIVEEGKRTENYVEIKLSTIDNAEIFYTTDGSIPNDQSLQYKNAVVVRNDCSVNTLVKRPGKKDIFGKYKMMAN